jgi:hypothetical protein
MSPSFGERAAYFFRRNRPQRRHGIALLLAAAVVLALVDMTAVPAVEYDDTPLLTEAPDHDETAAEKDEAADHHHEGEYNVIPEDPRSAAERRFRHHFDPLPAADAANDIDAHPAGKAAAKTAEGTLAAAFRRYERDPAAGDSVPVYGTACLGDADCGYVQQQLLSLDTGVGHVIVVMNGEHAAYHEFFDRLGKLFPGRFTFYAHAVKLSCSESWNTILKSAFAIRPKIEFAVVNNGDLWLLPTYLAKFARHVRAQGGNVGSTRFADFSSFAMLRRGWDAVGPFDEVIYPAYAEDVEYHLRTISKGMTIGRYPGKIQEGVSHMHAGSRSLKDPGFFPRFQRWDKSDYMFRKWGVDMNKYTDYADAVPFAHPFNIAGLSHRRSFAVDPVHRHCIRTGRGPRHLVTQHFASIRGCLLSHCNSCFYNASVLSELLPHGEHVPAWLLDQHRLNN